jgi:hypothetical protein
MNHFYHSVNNGCERALQWLTLQIRNDLHLQLTKASLANFSYFRQVSPTLPIKHSLPPASHQYQSSAALHKMVSLLLLAYDIRIAEIEIKLYAKLLRVVAVPYAKF